jgi:hypothetical protein
MNSDVISEGTNVNFFAEAYLLRFGFECLNLSAKCLGRMRSKKGKQARV